MACPERVNPRFHYALTYWNRRFTTLARPADRAGRHPQPRMNQRKQDKRLTMAG